MPTYNDATPSSAPAIEAISSAHIRLLTYRDLIDRLVCYLGAADTEAEQRRVRAAIQSAYSDLTQEHNWKYYISHERINLVASQTTGSVTYTSATRTLTLADATWPSWARYGYVRIANVDHRVESVTNTTTLVIDADLAPAANIAAGTSYQIFRSVYPLPPGIRRLLSVEDERSYWSTHYVPATTWLELHRHAQSSSLPWCWTILGDPNTYGSMCVGIYGVPTAARTLDLLIERSPRPMRLDGYARYSSQSGATLATAGVGTNDATFTNTTFRGDAVGAILRIGDTEATSAPEGEGAVNAYLEQRVITAVPDTTTLTLDSDWVYGRKSNYFAVSDPVDMPEYLLPAFYRRCEHELQVLLKNGPMADRAYAAYQLALREAMGRDNIEPSPTFSCGFLPSEISRWSDASNLSWYDD